MKETLGWSPSKILFVTLSLSLIPLLYYCVITGKVSPENTSTIINLFGSVLSGLLGFFISKSAVADTSKHLQETMKNNATVQNNNTVFVDDTKEAPLTPPPVSVAESFKAFQ